MPVLCSSANEIIRLASFQMFFFPCFFFPRASPLPLQTFADLRMGRV